MRTLDEHTLKGYGKLLRMLSHKVNLNDPGARTANSAGISVVLNHITGFPWEDPKEADDLLQGLNERLGRYEGLIAKVEHNRFNLERLSPMATQPEKYNLLVTGNWPCSSIFEWKSIPQSMEPRHSASLSSPLGYEVPFSAIGRPAIVLEKRESYMGSSDTAGFNKGA